MSHKGENKMKQKKYHMLLLLLVILNLLYFNKVEVNAWPAGDGDSNWNVEAVKTYNDFQYMHITETDSIVIVGYVGNNEVVVVPGEIDGKLVKEIVNFDDYTNYKAYQPNPVIREIYIPEGVVQVGGFRNCINIQKVQLPNSVEIILNDAFDGCQNLKQVTWPANLIQIESGAFAGCTKLKKVNLPYGIKKIGSAAFADCYSLKEIKIPDSVVEIGKEAFSGCKKLAKVKLSKNITVIREDSFSCCNIKSIQIPKKVTKIEEDAFASNQIESIIIPAKVKFIGRYAFGYCKKLKKITIKSTKVKKIEKNAFYYINKKATFDVPNKCKKKYKAMLIKAKCFKEGKMKIK